MRLSILCSSRGHPVWPWLEGWRERHSAGHAVELVETSAELSGGDLLFLVSCAELVGPAIRQAYRATLVLHASDLPEGRGWSPLVWQVLEGRRRIAVTLLEASEPVDSGPIWAQRWLELAGHELHDEIHARLFEAELALMDEAVEGFDHIAPRPQDDRPPTWHRRRGPEDSRVDPDRTLAEQFDLLRVCDPARYPAFFDFRGHRYLIRLERADHD
jgi:methionyl-tRNA formyltransferase